MNDFFETKDKQLTPYFFTRRDIQYHGSRLYGQSVYFLFAPKDRAQDLANLFVTRKAEPVQPKELLEAVEAYRDVIFEMKEKEKYATQRVG